MSLELVTVINNPRAAQAVADYMATQSIAVELRAIDKQQVQLWAEGKDYERVASQYAQFINNSEDKKYQAASWQSGSTDSPLRYQRGNSALRGAWNQAGWVTLSMVFACVAMYLLRYIGVYDWLAFPADGRFEPSQFWRWFTPALMHFSVLHITFNLLWWWMLGGLLEKHFSATFLVIFTLFTGVVSNVAQFVMTQSNYFGGLSGVVYALVGFCWLYGRLKPHQPVELQDNLFAFAMLWLVLGFADVLWVNMANTAHLSGLVSGLVIALVWSKVKTTARR
jgi:GlpG protein